MICHYCISPFQIFTHFTAERIYTLQFCRFHYAALFLSLGLLSTLIRHQNGAFRRR